MAIGPKLAHRTSDACALSVFFLCFELAAGFSFYLLELSVLVLTIGLIGCAIQRFGFCFAALGRWTLLVGQPGCAAICAVLGYLAVDLATSVRSAVPEVMAQKYRVTLALLVVWTALLFLRDTPGALQRARRAVAFSSTAVCAVTLLNYFVMPVYPIFYTLRLSLRSDYNMFATTVFLGMATGAFDSLQRSNFSRRATGVLFFVLPALPVILLSGSRRIYLVVWPTLAVLLLGWLHVEKNKRSADRLRAAAVVCGAAVLICAQLALLGAGMQRLYEQRGSRSAAGLLDFAFPQTETTLAARYATAGDGSMLFKRRVIWRVAAEELADYRPSELLFGRGGGENIRLYDRDRYAAALDTAYPDRARRQGALSAHNMLLADWLDGGLIKLFAGLGMLAILGERTLRRLMADPLETMPLAVALALCVLNSMISNRFGLLYDRHFFIFTALLAAGMGGKADGDEGRNADGGASPR